MSDQPNDTESLATPPPVAADLAAAVAATLYRTMAKPLPAGLYLVATPIGNLADVSLRALSTLAAVDVVLCEDTRRSRTLLAHYAITTRLDTYHEHNAEAARPRVLQALAEGKRMALISDAGMPTISDPGHKLVRAAIAAGHAVTVLPGPVAHLTALVGSGLPTDSYLFAGFLPRKAGQRAARLKALAGVEATLLMLESPQRIADTLRAIAETMGTRQVSVARELTKLHEEHLRGEATVIAAALGERVVKGEIVIVVGPPETPGATDDATVLRVLETKLAHMGLSQAARATALELDVPRGRIYALGLQLIKSAAVVPLPHDPEAQA